jgi:hypothetical protein
MSRIWLRSRQDHATQETRGHRLSRKAEPIGAEAVTVHREAKITGSTGRAPNAIANPVKATVAHTAKARSGGFRRS